MHLIATHKYDRFIKGLIDSAKEFFLTDEDVKFIVYTDSEFCLNSSDPQIFTIKITHEPWPGPSLKRFHYFQLSMNTIEESDFSFYIDVDSFFSKKITLEDLGVKEGFVGMIGTLHPGYYDTCGTPERRQISKAFIPYTASNKYFCGGFFGGNSKDFLEACRRLQKDIDDDFSNGVIAIWHDESHLNRFFYDNPPNSILGIGFSCPEEARFSDEKFKDPYIVFINKEADLKIDKGQDV